MKTVLATTADSDFMAKLHPGIVVLRCQLCLTVFATDEYSIRDSTKFVGESVVVDDCPKCGTLLNAELSEG